MLHNRLFAVGVTRTKASNVWKRVVPGEGVEPSWTEVRGILSPVRLPVSPPRLWTTSRGETLFYHISVLVSRDLEALGHHALRFQDADAWQIAVALVVVEAIADYEPLGDFKSAIGNREVNNATHLPVQERADLQA